MTFTRCSTQYNSTGVVQVILTPARHMMRSNEFCGRMYTIYSETLKVCQIEAIIAFCESQKITLKDHR